MSTEPLNVWMIFQVVAATEDAAVSALEEHVEKLESERGVLDMETEMDDVQEVDKPHPQIEKGYSRICEVELEVERFSDLVDIVINYGPTSVDVKAPEQVSMEIGEVRDALNSVAQMMHNFLQAGVGGTIISRSQEEQQ